MPNGQRSRRNRRPRVSLPRIKPRERHEPAEPLTNFCRLAAGSERRLMDALRESVQGRNGVAASGANRPGVLGDIAPQKSGAIQRAAQEGVIASL